MVKSSFLAALPLLLALAAAATAQPRDRADRAREHYTQGEMYMQAGVYDLAIEEYRQGYKLAPKAHGFLFNIGLAYEKMGDKKQARAAYERYLEREPKGKKAPEARARAEALRRQIEADPVPPKPDEEPADDGGEDGDGDGDDGAPDTGGGDDRVARGGDPAGGDGNGIMDPHLGDTDRPRRATSGRSWGLILTGVALVAAGVAADLAPDSSKNGQLDALDFLPVGLYVGGGFLVWRGAF